MTSLSSTSELTILYLITAAVLGTLFALVLSIRRMMSLEVKEEELVEKANKLELRSIAIEEKILQMQERILEEVKALKPKRARKK